MEQHANILNKHTAQVDHHSGQLEIVQKMVLEMRENVQSVVSQVVENDGRVKKIVESNGANTKSIVESNDLKVNTFRRRSSWTSTSS